ncbi:MAG: hypothetical protein WAW52_12815 [Methanothrix sp.]
MWKAFENAYKELSKNDKKNKLSDVMQILYEDIILNTQDIRFSISPPIIQNSKDDKIIDLMLQVDRKILELEVTMKSYEDRAVQTIVPDFADLMKIFACLCKEMEERSQDDFLASLKQIH